MTVENIILFNHLELHNAMSSEVSNILDNEFDPICYCRTSVDVVDKGQNNYHKKSESPSSN